MTARRYWPVIAWLVLAASWSACRGRSDGTGADTAGIPEAPTTEQVTLHFFKNPVTVPAFTVTDLDGRTHSSTSGKVILVNFWATWCGPCKAEIPELVKLQEKYRNYLQIIGVSQDEGSPDAVRAFAREHKMNYPVVMATPELDKLFPGISAIPTTFVLNRESKVVQKHVGMLVSLTTEQETRSLAGLPVNATIEEVDRAQPARLDNAAQATSIPGVDIASLSTERRIAAIQKLNTEACTCGCDLTVAKCRIDDPSCSVSLPLAQQIVKEITENR